MIRTKNVILKPSQIASELVLIRRISLKECGKPDKGLYICYCGKNFITSNYAVKTKQTTSCGCKRIDNPFNFKHGYAKEKLYQVWKSFRKRCNNKNCKDYKYYGGKGIKVCKKWANYVEFRKWAIKNSYKEGLSLDRINVNKDYKPSNCRWTNKLIQATNKNFKSNITGYTGVFKLTNNLYGAHISINLGTYKSAKEASLAYQKAKNERNNRYLNDGN